MGVEKWLDAVVVAVIVVEDDGGEVEGAADVEDVVVIVGLVDILGVVPSTKPEAGVRKL